MHGCMGGHDITTWRISQQYFSRPLPILLYISLCYEMAFFFKPGLNMLQMVTVCYSTVAVTVTTACPNQLLWNARGSVSACSRPRGKAKRRWWSRWDVLRSGWISVNLGESLGHSRRQSQMLPDPARRVACAVLSFVTSGDPWLWHSKGWIPMVWPCGLLPWFASQHCSQLEAASHQLKSPYLEWQLLKNYPFAHRCIISLLLFPSSGMGMLVHS